MQTRRVVRLSALRLSAAALAGIVHLSGPWAPVVPGADKQQTGSLSLEETETAIVLSHNSRPVLTYIKVSPPVPEGLNPLYHRSGCLHPVLSPAGKPVTAMFPADHPHQHGIFSAWVKTTWNERAIDFWNLAGGTGRVLHHQVVSTFIEDDTLGFVADLVHRAEQPPVVDILRERWRVTLLPTDGTYHAFDLQTTQEALTDQPLVIHQYHYGGVAVRGPVEWLLPNDRDVQRQNTSGPLPRILNDLGSDRVAGNHEHAKWVAMTGSADGKPATIAVLCHADNYRAPQAARLHPTKPYFVYSPCVDGEFIIDREHPYSARYRYLVTDSEPDPESLYEQWTAWHAE